MSIAKPEKLKAPFPWFGGKSRVAGIVWDRFGNPDNYIEPFFGSGAVFLNRPTEHEQPYNEILNDKDGYVANFWRAIKDDPEGVAKWADNPVFENDLHGRHKWLREQKDTLVQSLESDPHFYDSKIAGWWVWGIGCWIGSHWCETKSRQRPELTNRMGIHRRTLNGDIAGWFERLANRLRHARVICGDWLRCCNSYSTTTRAGRTAVFLDPPYTHRAGRSELYAVDSFDVGDQCFKYCLKHQDNPKMKLALCGYKGEYTFPESWECVAWKTQGGYGNAKKSGENTNQHRERIWFSPSCKESWD